MVAKSLDPLLFLKFQRRLKCAHQNWIRRTIYGLWCLRQICAHCTWSSISFFFFLSFAFFFFCYKSESGLIKMKHLWSLTSGSVLTPANAGCYNYPAGVSESPPTADAICLLTGARATAEHDFPRLCEWGELRLWNFGSPRTILSPQRQKEQGRKNDRWAILKPSPEMRKERKKILQSPLKSCLHSETKWLFQPLLLSSCAQGWHKPLISLSFFFYYIFLKSKFVLKRSYLDFYLFSVAAGRKCSAESRASACVWRPSSNGVTRGTRRYAYLSSVSKKFFVALRGIRTLIAFSTFAFALPFYYPLISSRLIFRLCCPKGIVGMWICPFIYCTDANYIFTLCLKQWQKKSARTHTPTGFWVRFILFFFFLYKEDLCT